MYNSSKLAGVAPSRQLVTLQSSQSLDGFSRFTPLPQSCGVYFLLKNKDIIYVGRSRKIHFRIQEHQLSGKEFDEYLVRESPWDESEHLEASYIFLFQPELNQVLPGYVGINSLKNLFDSKRKRATKKKIHQIVAGSNIQRTIWKGIEVFEKSAAIELLEASL